MQARYLLDVRLFETLAGSGLSAAARDRVVDLCESAVAIAADSGLPHPGRVARSAVILLVGIAEPALDPRVLHRLACLCEVVVMRGVATA